MSSSAFMKHISDHLKEDNGNDARLVERWESGECNDMWKTNIPYGSEETRHVPHGVSKALGKPLFQIIPFKKFNEGGTVVSVSENCVAIIPAGCRDGSISHTMQPYKYRIGGLSALSSLIHVVVLPISIRIYNAVTLKPEHLTLLDEMKQLGEHSVKILLNGSETMVGSLKWILSQDSSVTMNDGTTHSTKVDSEDISMRNGCQELWGKLQDSDVDTMMDTYLSSIKSSFHVGKNASIGWLHMHTRVSSLDTIAMDHMEDKSMEDGLYGKNTDVDEIIQYLKNKRSNP